jgi:hypothetical protein
MRRLWAAGAAISVCLALGGLPVFAQEASESPIPPGWTMVPWFAGLAPEALLDRDRVGHDCTVEPAYAFDMTVLLDFRRPGTSIRVWAARCVIPATEWATLTAGINEAVATALQGSGRLGVSGDVVREELEPPVIGQVASGRWDYRFYEVFGTLLVDAFDGPTGELWFVFTLRQQTGL